MKMFTELYDTFLMAGRTKMPPLTRKWQYVFMLAVITFNPGKSHMGITAVKKHIDDISDIRSPISVFLSVFLLPYLFKLFKIIFDQPVVSIFSWSSGGIRIKF
jgi:hypothetical protein